MGSSFEDIRYITSQIEDGERVGLCLDTAHAFAAGYDMVSRGAIALMLRRFDETIGLKKLKLVHLNDSKGGLGSRLDRHEHIGMGKIGTATALKAIGLGMRVVAHDPYVLNEVMASRGVEPANLDQVLEGSDYLSIHAWLSDETRHMIGKEELAKMKPTAFLINTARGEIVDQPALVRALEEGRIAGAGLDVTSDDPVAPDI